MQRLIFCFFFFRMMQRCARTHGSTHTISSQRARALLAYFFACAHTTSCNHFRFCVKFNFDAISYWAFLSNSIVKYTREKMHAPIIAGHIILQVHFHGTLHSYIRVPYPYPLHSAQCTCGKVNDAYWTRLHSSHPLLAIAKMQFHHKFWIKMLAHAKFYAPMETPIAIPSFCLPLVRVHCDFLHSFSR